ncbi:NAD-dependent succinate-semialdehyde dehydrogenase [Halopseudomonas aestusnigri]|jgi:succinate-semialdehyde dehydrogenase/glutarate-semialdehyde dehydrogenase|uniref:NAD-dependent succinate-semialdehyde dehydrogenase n=1 Tax=Halopseudomonas TaxID=2901189 RepID=UPI000C93FCB2|nr:NAD-dependent succinate-semialdehyde dehydrogenase [Halopseudomonas aestusnigri]MAK75491.1 succinate-semialdehyde dehydrogenase (NADP(+)) [Pseudomonadales bacterium]MEE2798792.1 NAD-dependent succinate-semialdehyde dehydrogenase [Pseudomonadota bacterium]HBT56099.1 succinate-semialdehyde dehydrogenase (NADP(+)) [Pseudomonas sp.]MAP76618.1 succinate-semialdehyde dehydrogenase (NADP(+)) [Pseudomonadales bacterium]MCC4259383.1 NAD-dependent succinate-semialdehyde dehydrogenase [Halopseudomonas|tara:strand:+ start:994 stop:2457 length:1464 start_codon:yes stop_codon:yes gene_type:complete
MSALSRLTESRLFRQQCLVGGQWVAASDGATIEVDNPASGEIIGSVPSLSEAQLTECIAQADQAFAEWRKTTALERADLLMRWYDLMLRHREDIASLMTLEQGKPLVESRGEVDYAASFIRWFAEEARRVYGETIPGAKPGQHIVVTRQPIGVTAAITPWNFPAAMITRKAGAALAAGCPMIVKPASATPFTALALGVLAEEAGIPAGVFNVVTGKASMISEVLTGSETVRKLSFTGSTSVGSQLMAQCAEHVQKVSLELGGNAPFIVFDDADLDRAVEGAMVCKFRNTGQTCVCANRFLVQSGIHDQFVEKLAEAMGKLKLGDGFEEGVTQSALINRAAVKKVQEHFDDALAKGAEHVAGASPGEAKGNYVEPVLVTGVTPDMQVCADETFGPLAAVMRFDTEEQAIALANDTPYGLAAYFYSTNIHRVWRVADALEAGIIGINEGAVSNAAAPFGGVKASGLGREGSRHGLDEYTEIKYLCMGGA